MDNSGPPRGADETIGSMFGIGVALVAIGTAASIIALLPLFLGLDAFPVAVYLLCFLAPVGLGLILVALWRRARTRSARLSSSPPGSSA
ncbi:MAG: hypothetical protein ABI720_00780 [Actinomycetes bacterium]